MREQKFFGAYHHGEYFVAYTKALAQSIQMILCILVMRNHLQNNCGLYGHRCTLLIHPHVINVISQWELAVVGIAAVGADGEIQ